MRTAIAILLMLACTGCIAERRTVNAPDRVPELPVAERPKLEPLTNDDVVEYTKMSPIVRGKLETNDARVKDYAREMEITIKVYNSYAKAHNAKARAYWDGTQTKAEKVPEETPK